jgi:hypothetical protein
LSGAEPLLALVGVVERLRSGDASVTASAPIPRIALRVPEEAAAALGVSADFFDKHIRHEVKLVRKSTLTFVSVADLERWCRENEARTLENGR